MKSTFMRVHVLACIFVLAALIEGCGEASKFLGFEKKYIPLIIEEINQSELESSKPDNHGTGGAPGINDIYSEGQDISVSPTVEGNYPIYNGILGATISNYSISRIAPDATGLTIKEDYDGDGIRNEEEVVTNPFVAEYPRIVTRITTPITMELRKSESSTSENYTELVEDEDVKNTITNSMEQKHYTQANAKTTPVPTKESQSSDETKSSSYSFSNERENATSVTIGIPLVNAYSVGQAQSSTSYSNRSNDSKSMSISDHFAQSTMSEKTIFENVNYIDNLDRNGLEFRNEKVLTMAKNYRMSQKTKSTWEIGPNAGYVRAGLYLKNDSLDRPARVGNVICTLSFRTPGGSIEPVKTFRLRNSDYSEFDQVIYGGEEKGPYTVEVENLDTFEVKKALRNGYVPQITVVSYDMHKVDDSSYYTGIDDLKIIEEQAKSRTATIKIIGTNCREIYRVAAFDVDASGNISPGISLKKALFNIYHDRVGRGEEWEKDMGGKQLTVADSGLKWKGGFEKDPNNPDGYILSENKRGNAWRLFETYMKSYIDEYNRTRRIETVKRIGGLSVYNPFDALDNPDYNPNEFIDESEIMKMKYWIIYHDGRYFEGDINDPIWAGERYEIVCVDIRDLTEHFKSFYYSPLESMEYFTLTTRWNGLNNDEETARARYLGRLVKGDVVHLAVKLEETRDLFDVAYDQSAGITRNEDGIWQWFNYTFENNEALPSGIPRQFSHYAEGDCNSIIVDVNESVNAHYYEISFREDCEKGTDCRNQWRTLKLSAQDLLDNNYRVYINRKTPAINGGEIGFLEGNLLNGQPLASSGRKYQVRVTAWGAVNGCNVPSYSMTNGSDEGIASVYGIEETTVPGGGYGFTCSAAGASDNRFEVRISPANYVEYYRIVCRGPYNYPYKGIMPPLSDENAPVHIFYGHSGLNRFMLENPEGEIVNAGLYRIEVYGVNQNSENNIVPETVGTNVSPFFTIDHDRYAAQRQLSPHIVRTKSRKEAIDLEVNFNDGNGWYRLKLDNSDTGAKTIDCRRTSYMNEMEQTFHVFFKPPAGMNDTEYTLKYIGNDDVFYGGKEETDLYIRTVGEKKYRDTFWMKKQANDPEALNTSLCYIIVSEAVEDFLEFWTGNEITDASAIEDTLAKHRAGLDTTSVLFSGWDLSKYFFSPRLYRVYNIKAGLEESLDISYVQMLDPVRFRVDADNCSFTVSEWNTGFAGTYEIWYKKGSMVGRDESVTESPWRQLSISDPSVRRQPGSYIIAMIARNEYGESEASFWDGNMGTIDREGAKIKPVILVDCEVPMTAPCIRGYVSQDAASITALVSRVQGQCRYILEIGEMYGDGSVIWRNLYDTYGMGAEVHGDVSYTFPIQGAGRHYRVRAAAVNLNGDVGPWGESAVIAVSHKDTEIELSDEIIFGSPIIEKVICDNFINWWPNAYYYPINLAINKIPGGATYYDVRGTIAVRYQAGAIQNQDPPISFSFNGIDSGNKEVKIADKVMLTIHGGFLVCKRQRAIGMEITVQVDARDEYGDIISSANKIYMLGKKDMPF